MTTGYKTSSNKLVMKPEQMQLVDDGTLDTIVECPFCHKRERYNFAESELMANEGDTTDAYEEFVRWATSEFAAEHMCYVIRKTFHGEQYAAFGIEWLAAGKVRGQKYYVREQKRNECFDLYTCGDNQPTKSFRNYACVRIEGTIDKYHVSDQQHAWVEIV